MEPGFALPSTRIGNYRKVSACLQQPETSRVQSAAKPEPHAPHFFNCIKSLYFYFSHIDIITDDICYISQYPAYWICDENHKRRVKLRNLEDGKEPDNAEKAGAY